jgi:hypothetical protein
MGNRLLHVPHYVTFSEIWSMGNHSGIGRFWKRRLSKARRRYIRDLLRLGRGKEPAGLESVVNWKDW